MTDQEILVKAYKFYTEFEFLWTELRSGTEQVKDSDPIDWVEILFTVPDSKVSYVMTGYSAMPDEPDSDRLALCGKLTEGDLEDVEPELFFQIITDLENTQGDAVL